MAPSLQLFKGAPVADQGVSDPSHVDTALLEPHQVNEVSIERIESGIDGIDLRDLNTIRAFQMGIRVGIEAIQQILSGSDVGPLGPKPLGERK